jgi:hypothetical protein
LEAYFPFEDNKSPKDNTITEFTRRQLSYSSDIYNAFHGILNSWSKAEPSDMIGHIFGIPVESYGLNLLWWGFDLPASRRKGFPTWSWFSRVGTIIFDSMEPLSSISVQARDYIGLKKIPESEAVPPEKTWVSIAEYSYQSTIGTRPSDAHDNPRLLRLTGWCPRVCMGWHPVDPYQYVRKFEGTIEKHDGRVRFKARYIHLDREDITRAEWESCLVLFVGSNQRLTYSSPPIELGFFVLCPTIEKDMYERVGIFSAELEGADDMASAGYERYVQI